ncbi:MAG: glycosyltransferase [Bacteroidota bacterium]
MKVLYISYDGMTDPLGQSQVIPYLEGLVKKGHTVTLISCEKPERAKDQSNIQQILAVAKIEWHPVQYTKKPPVISTIKDIRSIYKLAAHLVKENKIETVHCRSYIAALIGLRLKNNFNTKFIFDMRGFWADERVEGGIWNLKNPVYKIIYSYFKKKEKLFLEKADYIVSLTENAKQEILSWKNISHQPLKIDVIPCCVDMNLFDTTKISVTAIQNKKSELGLTDAAFVLSYVGSIGTWYLCDDMLQFFSRLLKQIPTAKFLFITPEEKEFVIAKARVQNIPIENLVILRASRNEMPLLLKCCDASIFFIKPSFSKKASSPVKQGEIMSMGIPIICNSKIGDTDLIVRESNAGFILDELTNDAFDKVITQLEKLKELNPTEIRKGAERFYSLEKGIDAYDSVYKKLSA